MNRFKEMFKYGNFRKRIVITFIEYMITSIIWIIIDQYMTYSLFDDAIAKENIKLVIFLSILMIVKIIANIAEGILNCFLRHHLQRDFSHYARNDIYKKIINSKVEFFDKSNTGELFELLMNDSGNFSTFFTQHGLQTSSYLVKTITYLIILLFVDLKLAAILTISYVIANGALIASNKKTFSLIGPDLYDGEIKYLSYIVRGIIDGDGWIRKDGREFFISSASNEFIKWCKKALIYLGFEDLEARFITNEFNGIYIIRSAKKYNLEVLKNKVYNKPFGMERKYKLLL